MANGSALVFAGIAPHPPIMVPEIGGDAIAEVRRSIDAMRELTERLIRSGAETVIIISPHAPLEPDAFVAYEGPQLSADFANFRAPAAGAQAELDSDLLSEIAGAAAEEKLATIKIKGDLDHGTAVPLYFLQRNGWLGRVVALGYSFLSNEDHLRFGRCIKAAIHKCGRPVGFIASGDLSHRLKPDAPAGYNSQAYLFDEEVVSAIRSGATDRIVKMDRELRRIAGECGYRSMLVAIGVAEGSEPRCEVISYEAPFGVGYMVAQLLSEPRRVGVAGGAVTEPLAVASGSTQVHQSTEATSGAHTALPALARRVIESFVTTGEIIDAPDPASDLFNQRAGCFVSIKTRAGDLRGCIGTIEPTKDTLAEELIANAISAATRDPRFSPLRKDELSALKYSVDVLTTPERCRREDLDPKIYGVIVEDHDGARRGLLLPNLAGIDTAAKQVEIAARKAGIKPDSDVRLWRFRADRYSESD